MIKTKISGTKHPHTFIMAHGAGAPMDSDWMNDLTKRLVAHGIRVVRFEFPYMNERRETGKKRPPNTKKILMETWQEVLQKEMKKSDSIFIGGKSMGGRIASLIANDVDIKGLIPLGFPFHAPGKEPGDRLQSLKDLNKPTLIVQGTRDSMGSKEECLSYDLSPAIHFHWLEDGDHSWKPRKKSGYTLEEHLDDAAKTIANFIEKHTA